jgi:FkbM family methyltransferase
MLKITSKLNAKGEVEIGHTCDFEIIRSSPEIETRSFLIHQDIHYLKPILDWNTENGINIFPEAPGSYLLLIEWRGPGLSSGWVSQPFQVIANVKTFNTPQQIDLGNKTHMWGPNEWEAIRLKAHEKPVMDLLAQIVRPSWVVYDIGANLGVYSIQFSRQVGQHGFVYCIEANPVCVYFLRANLEYNRISNCEILPVALSDIHRQIDFTINYSNSALGVTQNSPFYASKVGHDITVQGYSLDELIDEYHLKKPDLIKIDIEGAEGYAVKGMQKTIAQDRPLILVEVHGRTAAEMTFRELGKMGYHFQDISSQNQFTNVDQLIAWFPEAVLQFMCTPI